jgi:hypothetical protein
MLVLSRRTDAKGTGAEPAVRILPLRPEAGCAKENTERTKKRDKERNRFIITCPLKPAFAGGANVL